MTALTDASTRRAWFIHDFTVWGLPGLGEVEMLTDESVDSTITIHFHSTGIGVGQQQVSFSELIDHRGNNLPATIRSPRIIVRSRQETPVFIVGRETPATFKIARDPASAGSVTADLLIVEMGD